MDQYITHRDTNSFTNEGLGSHARGSIYPLLNIATATGYTPVLDNDTFWSNSGRNYKGINFSEFFSIDDKVPDGCSEILIDTWKEAFGQTEQLIDIIRSLIIDSKIATLVILSGPLRYVNPSIEVFDWFHNRCSRWHIKDQPTLAVHIRRGDMDVEVNQLDWFLSAIEIVVRFIPQIPVTIVTEENFTKTEEKELSDRFSHITLTRGGTTSMLKDVKTLASSSILIASKSYFSALAGFLGPNHGIIIVNEENDYFQTHVDIRHNVYTIDSQLLPEKLLMLSAQF